MNANTALDRLTEYAITHYATTTRQRHNPQDLPKESFQWHKAAVTRLLAEEIAAKCGKASLGEIVYTALSPYSKSFQDLNAETQAKWESTAAAFMRQVVEELRQSK